jgi:hypothetical protein
LLVKPAIGENLPTRSAKLQIGASVHDPNDPMGKLLFNILAFRPVRGRPDQTAHARGHGHRPRAQGKLRGKKPKLSDRQKKE